MKIKLRTVLALFLCLSVCLILVPAAFAEGGTEAVPVRFYSEKGYALTGLVVSDEAGREAEPVSDEDGLLYLLAPGAYSYRYHDERGIFLDLEETSFTVGAAEQEIPLDLTASFADTLFYASNVNPDIADLPGVADSVPTREEILDRLIEERIAAYDMAGPGAPPFLASGNYSVEAAGLELRNAMVNRETAITVRVSSAEPTQAAFDAIWDELFVIAFAHTGNQREGDTLKKNYRSYGGGGDVGVTSEGSGYIFDIPISISYMTNAEQENAVNNRVQSLVSELGLNGLSDYDKISIIHRYFYQNVDYVGDARYNDNTDLLKYTDYGALIQKDCVCQGFAVAFYRLCLAVGIDARYVKSQVMTHGWNIVELSDTYYELDATWDSNWRQYRETEEGLPHYFLRGSTWWLNNHTMKVDGEDYSTIGDQFHSDMEAYDPDFDNYNLSATDYVPSGTSGTWGGLRWSLDDSMEVLTISGSGPMNDFATDSAEAWLAHKDSIRSAVIKSGVTSIGDNAFRNCASLESASIPSSLTSIGGFAFYGDKLLGYKSAIRIPENVATIGAAAFASAAAYSDGFEVSASNTNFSAASGVLFNKGKTQLISCPGSKKGSYSVPSSVTSIASYAFMDCEQLTSVTLPAGVTGIEPFTFYGCSSMESIYMPSVRSIGIFSFASSGLKTVDIPDGVSDISCAFEYCKSLETVTIPSSLTSIGDNAFMFCDSLTNIVIPDGVTSIDGSAFFCCENLERVTLPASLKNIGPSAFFMSNYLFGSCKLTDVFYTGTQAQWDAITIGDSNSPLTSAAIHCDFTRDFIMPKYLSTIEDEAFAGGAFHYVFLSSTRTVGWHAFADCPNLKYIYVPTITDSIDPNAFDGVNGLTILGKCGSYAQTYAQQNGFAFLSFDY